jgi:Spy/CpxP family protein refolding chaperone
MKRTLFFAAIAIILAASLALAQHGPRASKAPRMGPGMMDDDFVRPRVILRWADEIGLNESQKTRIDKMVQEHGMMRIEKRAELEKAQLQLRHMIANDAPESDILKTMDNVGNLKTELRKMGYQHRRAIKGVLTDEQLDKIGELRREWRHQRQQRNPGRGSHLNFDKDNPGAGWGHGSGPRGDRSCWRR